MMIGREGITKEESLVSKEERKAGEWRESGEEGETRKRVVVKDMREVGDGGNGV